MFNAGDGSLANHLQLTATVNVLGGIDVSVTAVGGNFGLFGGLGNNGNDHAFAINVSGSGVSISNTF